MKRCPGAKIPPARHQGLVSVVDDGMVSVDCDRAAIVYFRADGVVGGAVRSWE